MTEDDALAMTSIIIPVRSDIKLTRCMARIDEDVEVVLTLNATTDEVRKIARESTHRSVVTEIDEATSAPRTTMACGSRAAGSCCSWTPTAYSARARSG